MKKIISTLLAVALVVMMVPMQLAFAAETSFTKDDFGATTGAYRGKVLSAAATLAQVPLSGANTGELEPGYYQVTVQSRSGYGADNADFDIEVRFGVIGGNENQYVTTGLVQTTTNAKTDTTYNDDVIGELKLTEDVLKWVNKSGNNFAAYYTYTGSNGPRIVSITLTKVRDIEKPLTPQEVADVKDDAPAYYYEALTQAVSGKEAYWTADVTKADGTGLGNKKIKATSANFEGNVSLYLVYQGTEATLSNVRLIWE